MRTCSCRRAFGAGDERDPGTVRRKLQRGSNLGPQGVRREPHVHAQVRRADRRGTPEKRGSAGRQQPGDEPQPPAMARADASRRACTIAIGALRAALADCSSCCSISIRASPMSRSRRRGSRSRQRASRWRIARGVVAGRRAQSISARSTSASVCVAVSPSNSRRFDSISNSTTPKDHTSARLSTTAPLACSGLM